MNRVLFLFDGLNIYHAMDDSGLHQFKWLDLSKLAKAFVRAQDEIVHVLYFTAFVTWDPQKLSRHRDYVEALRSVGVRPVFGQFKWKERLCRKCKRTYDTFEEKQTDVNIALALFRAAISNDYDTAMIVSGDSDLVPAIEAVKSTFPGKRIGVVIPVGRRAEHLKNVADFHMRMKRKHLQRSQFDDVVDLGGGRQVKRPASWK